MSTPAVKASVANVCLATWNENFFLFRHLWPNREVCFYTKYSTWEIRGLQKKHPLVPASISGHSCSMANTTMRRFYTGVSLPATYSRFTDMFPTQVFDVHDAQTAETGKQECSLHIIPAARSCNKAFYFLYCKIFTFGFRI